jgi:hypothetical protein
MVIVSDAKILSVTPGAQLMTLAKAKAKATQHFYSTEAVFLVLCDPFMNEL